MNYGAEPIRTLVFLIETKCTEQEVLRPYTIRALKEYIIALEANVVGKNDVEKWTTQDRRSVIKTVHGNDAVSFREPEPKKIKPRVIKNRLDFGNSKKTNKRR